MAKITTDDAAVLHKAEEELKSVLKQFAFVWEQRTMLSDDAVNAIIGHSTRQAIERLNVVRDQWAFDAVNRDETGDLPN